MLARPDLCFRLTLAWDLGLTLGELERRLEPGELLLWKAWYALEPRGARRGDHQAAVVACVTANLFQGNNQPAQPFKDFLLDFRPRRRRKPDRNAWKADRDFLLVMTRRLGGTVIRNGKVEEVASGRKRNR